MYKVQRNIFIVLLSFLTSVQYFSKQCLAQYSDVTSCIKEYTLTPPIDTLTDKIILKNNTGSVIRCLFEFPSNVFFEESSLIQFILRGTDSTKSKSENQLIVLDNIAYLIKSPFHRNFHLLFFANSSFASVIKYSPLALMSSFYDKQCHDYQRLAAQIAIMTPFFEKADFVRFLLKHHTVLDIKIGDKYVCHDFDPGQPGFRFLQ